MPDEKIIDDQPWYTPCSSTPLKATIAPKYDPVNHPDHYTTGKIECIDWIRLALTPEEFKGYLKGCQLKYFWRHELKGDPVQDLEKHTWYVNKLIETIKEGQSS